MLTIGMLTHDDYDGVYFTINAIRTYHQDVLDQLHFVVVDNNPDSAHGREVQNLLRILPNAHYTAARGTTGSVLKNIVFEVAPTDQVLCLDCHVLLWPNSLKRLMKFYELNPSMRHDLIHGPLLTEQHNVLATHMEPNFRGWNFGTWANNGKANSETDAPFEIPLHGMGLFACSRDGWPRFASGMRYFGAEEGSIHERFRRMGRKAWCLPFLRWMHRFGRPGGPGYTNTAESKTRSYLKAFRDAGLSIEWVCEYYARHLDSDVEAGHAKMDALRQWALTLPESPLPAAPEGYKPFLGEPIQLLD